MSKCAKIQQSKLIKKQSKLSFPFYRILKVGQEKPTINFNPNLKRNYCYFTCKLKITGITCKKTLGKKKSFYKISREILRKKCMMNTVCSLASTLD